MSTRYGLWVRVGPDHRVRISERGVLIGRRDDCDIIVEDPHASLLHAMVLRAPVGAELHALGLNPTLLNGEAVRRKASVHPGDRIEVPGAVLLVEATGIEDEPDGGWVLEVGNRRHGLRADLRLGGGEGDDLWVAGWPAGAVHVSLVQGGLVADFAAEMQLDGETVEAGSVEMLEDGDTIACDGRVVRVRARGGGQRDTLRALGANLPVFARLAFMPTGGELTMEFVDGRRVTLQLSERRASLVACLLAPPGEYEAGDFVPDELLVGRVWPGQGERGRMDVNTLVHRTRKDLVRAGVNPAPILARAKGGRATSFRLAPGGRAEVV